MRQVSQLPVSTSTLMSEQGSNSELFAHENNALTARPQLLKLKLACLLRNISLNNERNGVVSKSMMKQKVG